MIMAAAAAASAVDWNSLISYIPTLVTGAGMAGLWVLANLRGWQVSAGSHAETCQERDRALADRDSWRDLYLKEHEAHQHTREALSAASQRGDAGVESARMVVSLMEALRAQTAAVPDEVHPAPGQGRGRRGGG